MREMLQLVSAEPGICLEDGIHQHLVFGGQSKGAGFYVSRNDRAPAPVCSCDFIHNRTVLPRSNLLREKGSILRNETPHLAIIEQLLKLVSAQATSFIQDIGSHIDCSAHANPFSPSQRKRYPNHTLSVHAQQNICTKSVASPAQFKTFKNASAPSRPGVIRAAAASL